MPELKIYTVKDLREWLENNHPAEGLSERVIAPTRAWAIIHNPYVKDEDAIVAAILEDGELAAYTASFPDMLDGKRVWWASTLYCYPKFTGKGYGLIVVGSLVEAHEPDITYDRWGAKETVEIFSHLGYQTTYTSRYCLSQKSINMSTMRGKLAYCAQAIQKCLHPWPKLSNADFTLRYASCIDGEAYAFMQEHKCMDLWLREQDMLNWILKYPFGQGCTLLDRVIKEKEFNTLVGIYGYKVVKVFIGTQLHGLYILRQNDDALSVISIYYDNSYSELVFASIIDHIIAIKPQSFVTENKDLLEYVRRKLYFPKKAEEKVSFSLPSLPDIPQYSLQMGDGDSFA